MPVAHAVYDPNPKHSKWYVDRLMADPLRKSTVEIKAQRNYPVSTLGADGKPIKQIRNAKSTIVLGANASNVGKSLVRRVPAIAITNALLALGLKAVDWTIDAANDSVYWIDGGGPNSDWETSGVTATRANSQSASCMLYKSVLSSTGNSYAADLKFTNGKCISNGIVFSQSEFPRPPTESVKTYVPISDVSNKIIEQANAGEAPALQVMNDAALDALEAGLLDSQLNAASDIPQPDAQEITQEQYDNPNYPVDGTGTGSGSGTDTETPVDPDAPTDPDAPSPDAKPFELPPFCSWASKVCEWADWTMEDAETPPDTPLPEKDIQMTDPSVFDKSYISVDEQCPADIDVSIPVGPTSFPLVIPITPICYFGSTYVSPVLQFMAYIFVALGISRSLRVG